MMSKQLTNLSILTLHLQLGSVEGYYRQRLQNDNMGRSDQQTAREGKKLDLQSSQPGREAYPYQRGSTSDPDVYDVSVSISQRSTTKYKSHSKIFPMVRCRN
jgi:hypothetical protein